jgi:hypothetical protein
MTMVWRAAAVCLVAVFLAARARAADELFLMNQGDNHLKATIQLDSALFYDGNAWFGEAEANAGDHLHFWGEFGAMPGLEGQFSLGEAGSLRGRVSGVWTTTQFGLDAAGSNFDDRHPDELTLEEAYVGWKSGDLFPSLGKDAIDISFGSQRYQVGSGFLFWDGSTDGGSERGGYWLGMRKAFELSAIFRLTTGPFMGELVYLQPNDDPDTSTDVMGVNLEWTFGEDGKLGGGYWTITDSDNLRRDDLDIFDLRGEVHPLAFRPGLVLSGEMVYETNGDLNKSWGRYAEIGHSWDSAPCKPYLSYRWASFTGDHGGPDQIEAFDPIFYGFSDWETWYIGEILGEYIGTNRNLIAHTFRVRTQPAEAWTVNLFWMIFRLDELATDLTPRLFDPRAVNITDKNLGNEVDVTVDWKMGDHVSWSAVAGALFPAKGLEQGTGGHSVWTHFMLYASISF